MVKMSQQAKIEKLATLVDHVFEGISSNSFRHPISLLDISPTIAYFNTSPGYAGRYNLTVESSPEKLDRNGLVKTLKYEIIFTKK